MYLIWNSILQKSCLEQQDFQMYGKVNLWTFIVKMYYLHACWNYSAFAMTHEITYLCRSWNVLTISKIIENPNAEKSHFHLISDWNVKEPSYSVTILKNSQTWAIAQAPSSAAGHTNIQKIHPTKHGFHVQIHKQKHTLSLYPLHVFFTCILVKFWPKRFHQFESC